LRLDNAREYVSKEFCTFCREARIKRKLTVPCNPWWNEVAERKNKSIIETAKAMIHELNLPVYLGAEACCKAVYILNMCLKQDIEGQGTLRSFYW